MAAKYGSKPTLLPRLTTARHQAQIAWIDWDHLLYSSLNLYVVDKHGETLVAVILQEYRRAKFEDCQTWLWASVQPQCSRLPIHLLIRAPGALGPPALESFAGNSTEAAS